MAGKTRDRFVVLFCPLVGSIVDEDFFLGSFTSGKSFSHEISRTLLWFWVEMNLVSFRLICLNGKISQIGLTRKAFTLAHDEANKAHRII